MYRLLIVTTNRLKRHAGLHGGVGSAGVKPPRVRETVEDAVECMKKHPIDAIAVEDAPVFAPLADYLDRQAPAVPVFAIEADAKTQLETVRQTVNLLTACVPTTPTTSTTPPT